MSSGSAGDGDHSANLTAAIQGKGPGFLGTSVVAGDLVSHAAGKILTY